MSKNAKNGAKFSHPFFLGPAELLGKTTKFHDSSFDSYGGSD